MAPRGHIPYRARVSRVRWCSTVGLLCGCARLHLSEMSLDAVEMVVEGSEVEAAAQQVVFGELRKLQSFVG